MRSFRSIRIAAALILSAAMLAFPVSSMAEPVVSVAATGSGSYAAVQVLTGSATKVATASTAPSRKNITIQNLGPNDIYCGFDTSVTTATGMKVAANTGVLSIDLGPNVTVYCRAASADQSSPADTRVWELR
jgi:hypothetical protein